MTASITPLPRAMGLAPARAETPQAAQGRSPAGPVTRGSAAGAQTASELLSHHYANPSENHRSIIYASLIFATQAKRKDERR